MVLCYGRALHSQPQAPSLPGGPGADDPKQRLTTHLFDEHTSRANGDATDR